MTTPADTKIVPNAFTEALIDLEEGSLMAELHNAVKEIVGAVRSERKGGSLTLKITFNLATSKGASDMLMVYSDVVKKLPKAERSSTVMFADDANNLTRRNKNQPELAGLHTLPPPADVRPFPMAVNDRSLPATPDTGAE